MSHILLQAYALEPMLHEEDQAPQWEAHVLQWGKKNLLKAAKTQPKPKINKKVY